MTPDLNIAYTIGYTGKKIAEVLRVREELDAVLVDVRFRPGSKKNPEWNKSALMQAVGPGNYSHIQALGNTNYRQERKHMNDKNWHGVPGTNIIFKNLAAGLSDLQFILVQRPVILMCTCINIYSCHRLQIGNALEDKGYDVVHLDQAMIDVILGKPEPPQQLKLL